MPFQIIDATGNVKTARTVTGGALLAAQNTFSNTSGQIIQGPLDLTAATAGQIKFPASQNASSGVNTLDDYEEGTWTPTILGSTGTSGQSYATQTGTYVKVGKLVSVGFYVILSAAGTITGLAQIGGLPFTNDAYIQSGAVSYFLALNTSWTTLGAYINASVAVATLFGTQGVATGITNVATTDITNTTRIMGGFTYRASA
jgi:predicted RecA/RadA family phage recombinase